MNRLLAALTVLLLLAVAPMALAVSGSYKDTFESRDYAGNDGSLDWSGPWKEVSPESDGPDAGAVTVEESGCSDQCLTISTGLLGTAGAYRLADTENFADAKLSYWVDFDAGFLLNATLTVAATSNGGDSWSTIKTVLLGSEGTHSVDVTDFRASEFGVRFTATGALGAKVFIDDVTVSGQLLPPPTTTTTTTTTSTTTTTTTLLTLPPPTLPGLDSTTTTTTTTAPKSSSTTTAPSSSSTTTAPNSSSTTTTTEASDVTTPLAAAGGGDTGGPGGGDGGGSGTTASGLRPTQVGVGSDFETGLFGSMPEVLAFEIDPGYANAVELIEASWYWVLALALLIAATLIKGIDHRIGGVKGPE
ncbi:MAG: hypothetical protein ACRDVL_02765 [Acidimicrobiia bacterium]